jgi:hypothetical protein
MSLFLFTTMGSGCEMDSHLSAPLHLASSTCARDVPESHQRMYHIAGGST